MYERVSTASFSGEPRVYLQGKYLLRAGFRPSASIEIEFGPGRVTLRPSPAGTRTVSSKQGGAVPVIDIQNKALGEAFAGCKVLTVRVREHEIVLTPSERERLRRSRCRDNTAGDVFAGGGLLSEAAKQAGLRLRWAIERDPDYAEVHEANHPEAKMFNCCVSEVPLGELEPVGTVIAGIPCEPFSKGRTQDRKTGAKRDRSLPACAHELGDMTAWLMLVISRVNPESVIVEEVPGFLDSDAGWMLRRFLERSGYNVEARVIDPTEYGELTGRARAVIVATTDRPVAWPALRPEPTRQLSEVLDPAEAVEPEWFTEATKPWLYRHWREQTAKGNGFEPPKLAGDCRRVPVIKKRYFAQQGDNPVVQHPERPDTHRWFTLAEVKRLHGVPEGYWLGEAKTRAGEVLGQGVVVSLFRRIIEAALSGAGAVAEAAAPPRGQLSFFAA